MGDAFENALKNVLFDIVCSECINLIQAHTTLSWIW